MPQDALRILVVDDTVTYRHIVRQLLAEIPGVEVVGTAANGRFALQKLEQLQPDLLTLDLEMPELDGLGVLRELKQRGSQVGVLMLSALTAQGAEATVQALELGAFDFILKTHGANAQDNAERLRSDLQRKIEAFARARQIRRLLKNGLPLRSTPSAPACVDPAQRIPTALTPMPRRAAESPPVAPAASASASRAITDVLRRTQQVVDSRGRIDVVAVGVSTGGPRALTQMLPELPGDLPVPILLVQHMPPLFTKSLAQDLDKRCQLTVCEANDGQPVLPGHVLIAPGGKQMRVEKEDAQVCVRVTDEPPENSCRPSIDHLFRSVAEVYGGNALAVIMTGMGNDGAVACRSLKQRGATLLCQDEASCVVYGMPRQPIEEGLADVVAPLGRLAGEIQRLVGQGGFRCK